MILHSSNAVELKRKITLGIGPVAYQQLKAPHEHISAAAANKPIIGADNKTGMCGMHVHVCMMWEQM